MPARHAARRLLGNRPAARRPMRGRTAARCAPGGFTLVEVLLAVSLSAMLLIGTAALAGVFSEQVAALAEDTVDDHEAALARIASDVHYAWWAAVPRSNVLEVADASGALTRYRWVDDELLVRLPGGEEGVLCDGVAACTFSPIEVTRWRDGPVDVVGRTLYSVGQTGFSLPIEVGQSGELAVGFTLDSDVGVRSVDGVGEQLVAAAPSSVQLTIGLAKSGGAELAITLYEARAPGDPRPRDDVAALGTAQVQLDALPTVSLTTAWRLLFGNDDLFDELTLLDKVRISPRYRTPTETVAFDVASAFPDLEPGVAYSLVVTVIGGPGVTVLAGYSGIGASGNVAFRDAPGDAFDTQPYVVPLVISGSATVTSTVASDEIGLIKAELVADSGRSWVRSAAVYSQVMAPDPWLGVVAGETAPDRR